MYVYQLVGNIFEIKFVIKSRHNIEFLRAFFLKKKKRGRERNNYDCKVKNKFSFFFCFCFLFFHHFVVSRLYKLLFLCDQKKKPNQTCLIKIRYAYSNDEGRRNDKTYIGIYGNVIIKS